MTEPDDQLDDEQDNEDEGTTEGGDPHAQLQIDVDEQVAQGVYSNLAISTVNREEFILDFVYLQPNMPRGRIVSRVILTPNNARRLAQMLAKNVEEYDSQKGDLPDDGQLPGFRLSYN